MLTMLKKIAAATLSASLFFVAVPAFAAGKPAKSTPKAPTTMVHKQAPRPASKPVKQVNKMSPKAPKASKPTKTH